MTLQLTRPPLPSIVPWLDISSFENHPLAQELDVPGRLRWIDALVDRTKLNDDKRVQPRFIDDLRRRIENRERESRLFLGIVGEFSSGKSTLINALIRQRLLRSDILQGTTAAATMLAYGAEFAVTVQYLPGNIISRAARKVHQGVRMVLGNLKRTKLPTREKLLNLLHRCTSDELFARDVQQVNVTLPSDSLRDGVVIVDTPGTNATNPRHGEVTAAALRDICDATLVVMPADAAGTESLLCYLREHATDVLHRCLFLVTKVDLLRREKDRILVLENLRARLSAQLGITDPQVLAAAPQLVVDSLPHDLPAAATTNSVTNQEREQDGFTAVEIERWTEQFQLMEEALRPLLREKRIQAQAEDIGKLLEQIYQRLREALRCRLDGYRERHEAMERILIPDIHAFTVEKRDVHVARARSAIERAGRHLQHELTETAEKMVARMCNSIYSAPSRRKLKEVMESTILGILAGTESSLRCQVDRVAKQFETVAYAELKAFHVAFQQHYRSLASLGGRLEVDKSAATAILSDATSSSSGLAFGLGTNVAELLGEHQLRMVGGAAAGGVVGTALLPGVGTVLGALFGTLFSRLFGPSLDELKASCWGALKDRVRDELTSSIKETLQAVEDSADALLQGLAATIEDYEPKYNHLVQEMRARDAAEKTELVRLQGEVASELSGIDQQRAPLADIQARIRTMTISASSTSSLRSG